MRKGVVSFAIALTAVAVLAVPAASAHRRRPGDRVAEDKPKLLIVEDDPGLQKQLKWCFDDYEVIAAMDRPAALAALRRSCGSIEPSRP